MTERLHLGMRENQNGLIMLYSLMVEPLLWLPATAFEDEVRTKTIWDHPELFGITCQIDVDVFEKLLASHHNLAFGWSVLLGPLWG